MNPDLQNSNLKVFPLTDVTITKVVNGSKPEVTTLEDVCYLYEFNENEHCIIQIIKDNKYEIFEFDKNDVQNSTQYLIASKTVSITDTIYYKIDIKCNKNESIY